MKKVWRMIRLAGDILDWIDDVIAFMATQTRNQRARQLQQRGNELLRKVR